MADADKPTNEPGAPVPKDAIDPDLVKLRRARPKIGIITSAGLVFLCGYFLWKLGPDRRFSGSAEQPGKAQVADVLSGKVDLDRYVTLEAEPLRSHAIRTTTSKGSLGLRVAPVRGTGERLWIVLSGDGWENPTVTGYTGRLRTLADLPFAPSIKDYAATHPRPVFAAASAVRAGFATGKVATVGGEEVTLADADRVAFDVVDPNEAVIVGAFTDRMPNAAAWSTALGAAGITPKGAPQATTEQARFEVTMPGAVATLTTKLEAANLWAARVDPVTHHYETTWGKLKASSPAGFTVEGTTIPDAQLDLVGLYVARSIPSDAYALITGEKPEDYWYVLPVTVVVGLIGLVFAWALVRAVKRDVLQA